MINLNDVNEAAELVRCRNSLLWTIARYSGGGVAMYEHDSDHKGTTPSIPASLGREVLGAALGMVTTRLLALGVDIPEITDRECFDCGGTGTQKKDNR